jgi:hypothetical protein
MGPQPIVAGFLDRINQMNEQAQHLTHFVVVGKLAWGRDESLETAVLNWIRHARPSPREDHTVHVRYTTSDSYVDGLGTLYATRIEKLPDVTLPRTLIAALADVRYRLEEVLEPVEDASIDLE